MKQELKALLDKRGALAKEADSIISAADKDNEGNLTAEQTARLNAIRAEGDAAVASMEALVASMPDESASKEASDKAAADATASARTVAADIAAACAMAGQAAKASAFIKEGKSLSDVVAALQSAKVEASGRDVSNHAGGNLADGPTWDKAIARQNDRITA